jgi:hypothetical protein
MFCKLSLILHSVRRELKDRFLISLFLRSAKFLKGLTWLYLPMVKLVLAKLIPCLVVIGKPWYLKIWIPKGRTLFFKIWLLIKILLVLFQERFINFSMKLKHMKKQSPSSGYTAHFFKFITKRYMISCKIFRNQKLWTCTNRN